MSQATEDCKGVGLVQPVIDRNRCEGKTDCVRVCPYHVFAMGTLNAEQRAGLTWIGKLKAWGHGYQQAFVVNGAACENCGLCVTACPERAIKLAAVRPA